MALGSFGKLILILVGVVAITSLVATLVVMKIETAKEEQTNSAFEVPTVYEFTAGDDWLC